MQRFNAVFRLISLLLAVFGLILASRALFLPERVTTPNRHGHDNPWRRLGVYGFQSWSRTPGFFEKLIQCESQGASISRPDSNGRMSDGILQFNRGPLDTLQISTWEFFSKGRHHGKPRRAVGCDQDGGLGDQQGIFGPLDLCPDLESRLEQTLHKDIVASLNLTGEYLTLERGYRDVFTATLDSRDRDLRRPTHSPHTAHDRGRPAHPRSMGAHQANVARAAT